jgi:hypothetical protein
VPACLDTGPASVPFLNRVFATSVGQSEGTCGTLGETGGELGNGRIRWQKEVTIICMSLVMIGPLADLADDMYSQTQFVKYVIRTTSGVAKERPGRRCGRSLGRPCSNVAVSARHASLMASDHRVCTEEWYGNPRLLNAHALIITRGTSF